MNYLAHAYLSFNHEPTLVGNMISDYVKGKKKFDYAIEIQRGIELHRKIDAFTDAHEITKQAKQYFKTSVGAYAGAFVDVVYDHFLALDVNVFSTSVHLNNFATTTYQLLQSNHQIMPDKFGKMLPYMQQQNWFYNYQFLWGIEKSFEGVVRRANYLSSAVTAFDAFQENYSQLQNCYHAFFIDVKKMALQEFEFMQKF